MVVFSNVTCLAVAESAAVAAPIRTNSELIRTISELNEPAFSRLETVFVRTR